MYTNIFFLFIILLTIGSVPAITSTEVLPESPFLGFLAGITLYLFILSLISFQNLILFKNLRKDTKLFVSSSEIVIFFITALFILGMQRPFMAGVLTPFNTTLFSIFALLLYFLALFIHHFTSNLSGWGKVDAKRKALFAISFLVPFAIPFLVLIMVADASSILPLKSLEDFLGIKSDSNFETFLIATYSLLSLVVTMIFLPPILVYAWNCKRPKNSPLMTRLDELCKKAKFTHAGFRIWTVMEGSINAAIVGIIAPFRYVMFTPKLLDYLSPDAVEAILAHEIGHKRHHHLLIYPFILMGMLLSAFAGSSLIIEWINQSIIIQNLFSETTWAIIAPFMTFIPFIAIAGIYYRLVFGYFSRLFERQADLYVFEIGIPASSMIEALDIIGHTAGNIHRDPNWHHHSIYDRIHILKQADKDPSMIKKHSNKVKISLTLYLILLILAGCYLLLSAA